MLFQIIATFLLLLFRPLEAQSVVGEHSDQKQESDSQRRAEKSETVIFHPPTGWRLVDTPDFLPRTQVMVVGPKEGDYPPSINLSTEKFDGSLKDYLKMIKEINQSQQSEWKELGKIHTKAGDASLSQTDAATEWGNVRMMHAILLKNGMIHILTAAALKTDFPKHYKEFFESLRSLAIRYDSDEIAQGEPSPSNQEEGKSKHEEQKLSDHNPERFTKTI